MLALYTSRSTNTKTGDIPQQLVGQTQQECYDSCEGCPLRPVINEQGKPQDSECYAWRGLSHMGAVSMWTSAERGKDQTLATALKKRAKTAKFVRFGRQGDPSAIDKKQIKKDIKDIRAEGLGVLGYTHKWRTTGKHLKGQLMASCDTWDDVRDAKKQGWRATLYQISVEGNKGITEDGIKWVKCPYQTDKNVQCNDCGLCDATRAPKLDLVIFVKH